MATPTTSSDVSLSTLSGENYIDALIAGTQWASATITYSFPTFSSYWSTNSTYGYGSPSGSDEPWSWLYEPLTSTEQTRFAVALQTWTNVANIKFVKVSDNASVVGDIRIAYSYDGTNSEAWAYLPTSGATYSGDIWINALGYSYHANYASGSYSFMTLIHEIGHAIGLKHPFSTNSGNTVTLANSGYDNFDSLVFTIMSYSGQAGDPTTYLSYQPTTPMLLDILAIQQLYGANTTYKSGSDVYRFSTDRTYLQTIYDVGGLDEIACDGMRAVQLDLRDGCGSTIGNAIYELDQYGNRIGTVAENLWIAFGVEIENATGGNGDDSITGNNFSNLLNGGIGADTLIGGLGDDTYVIDNTGDVITEAVSEGNDTIQIKIAIASGTYELGANIENAALLNTIAYNLTGNELDNSLTGNAYANTLRGNAGDDTLDGKAGADILIGGGGNDLYFIDNAGDFVTEVAEQGRDEVRSTVSHILNDNVENLTLLGAVAINATGNGDANILTGNIAANILDGKAGTDTMSGSEGRDTYVVDDVGDVVVEGLTALQGGGIDLVKSSVSFDLSYAGNGNNRSQIENLELTDKQPPLDPANDINGTGNGLNNTLTGNSGNNRLDGGMGADIMLGGAGNDTYVVDTIGDKVYETTTTASTINAGGTDTVEASINYTLGNFVENLALTGSANTNGTGNALANTITGNSGNNVLNGGAGNDTLSGGDGNDIFRFDTALNSTTNVDTIQDFARGEDVIQLKNSIFTKLTSTGGLSEANFRSGGSVSAQDANDFILYDTTSSGLYYDADGNGAGAAIHFATLIGQPNLTHTDFFIT